MAALLGDTSGQDGRTDNTDAALSLHSGGRSRGATTPAEPYRKASKDPNMLEG